MLLKLIMSVIMTWMMLLRLPMLLLIRVVLKTKLATRWSSTGLRRTEKHLEGKNSDVELWQRNLGDARGVEP